MWPDPGEALSHTISAETAMSDLYAEALRRWAPTARAAALPSLTAAALPPNPDAVTQQQATGEWSAATEAVIVAGVALLWSAAVIEAMDALGIPLPPLPDGATPNVSTSGVDATVLRTIDYAIGDMNSTDVVTAAARVDADPTLQRFRDEAVERQRTRAAAVPMAVSDKATMAVRMAAEFSRDQSVDEQMASGRAAAAEALDPAGSDMRDLARNEGYQAAGLLNHAVITAAQQQNTDAEAVGAGEELEKTWIATLDGKTRPTHWAADGQRVPLDGHFTIGSEQMFVPGDETASPAEWKNCRCRVGVLAKGEPLPDEVDRHTERLDGRDSVAVNRDGRTQAEEIDRRNEAGNVRARDDQDGIGRVASGGWAAQSEQEHQMAGEQDTATETFLTFSGYIGKLGVPTSDRRILAADIDLTMREFPHPMAWQKQASGGHYDSFTVGVVEEAKIDGDRVWASGYFLNSTEADEAADQVKHQVSAPSLDLAACESIFTDEDGKEIEGDLYDWWEENGDPYLYSTKAEVTGFTLVQTPAFDGIDITLGERETRDLALVASMVAAVDEPRVRTYDPSLFADPKLTRPTAPTMNNETGRIYGHLAEFGHPYRGGDGSLTPRNHNDYMNFHTSQVQLDDGRQLSVGRLTVQGGHADTAASVTVATARAHYDNVCTAFGLVRVGEDRFGIWFSGVPAPGVSPEVLQQGMTAPLSGDWRDCGFGLDMIGAHAVNSPGFPIYSAVTGADGREVALVASLGPSRKSARKDVGGGFTLDQDTLRAIITEAVDAVDQRNAQRTAETRRQDEFATKRQGALARAQELVGPPPTPRDRIGALLDAGSGEH